MLMLTMCNAVRDLIRPTPTISYSTPPPTTTIPTSNTLWAIDERSHAGPRDRIPWTTYRPSPRSYDRRPRPGPTRKYAIAVDRGRHSTRFLLFSRIPTSRVRTYSATAVSQGRVPVRDRGHDVVYCSRKRLSVSGTDERIREYSTERIRKAEWDI